MSDATIRDRGLAPYVHSAEAYEDYRRGVLGFHRAEARRSQTITRGFKMGLIASAALNLLLGAGMYHMLPLIRVVPVWVWARPDGTVDSATSTASLPETLNEAQKRAWLWQYVRARESYNPVEADYNYTIVSAMSSPSVRAVYQEWENNKNPAVPSPAKILGRQGYISVTFRDSEIVGDHFHVRFFRSVKEEGRPATCTAWAANMIFGELYTAPIMQRVTYNPGAIVVIGYPGAEPEGSAPNNGPLPVVQGCANT